MPSSARSTLDTSRRRGSAAPTPERILSAALAAFGARGFDGATTREIAAAAGVPQGLVTYHYASKQALWEAAVDWLFGELAEEFAVVADAMRDVPAADRWRAMIKRLVRFAARRPELSRFMAQEGVQDGPRLRWLVDRHVRPLFEQSAALIREALPGVDAGRFHYVLLGAITCPLAVAAEVQRMTGRDVRSPREVEAHANAIIEWLIDPALERAPSAPKRATHTHRARVRP